MTEQSAAEQPTLSVVIPTKNRSADLERCLESLAGQVDASVEVFVIDNGSTDQTVQTLARFPWVRVLHDPTPNLARLFNRGWRESNSEAIAFLNDDTEVAGDYVRELHKWLRFLPNAAALGGPTLDQRPRALTRLYEGGNALLKVYDIFLLQGRIKELGVLTPWGAFSIGTTSGPTPKRVTCLTITNMVVRRSVLLKLGGFDEAFRYAHIDGEFFHRCLRAGQVLYAVPTPAVRHFVNPSGATRSLYFLARDQAVFTAKLSPKRGKEKALRTLNLIAFFLFWLLQGPRRAIATLPDLLRGYFEGRRMVTTTSARASLPGEPPASRAR